jgi:CRISPR/Cas system-associated exonuclease Cas4 (RecB family)
MPDLYLSYTGRKTYITCPQKYWFKYIRKHKVTDDPRKAIFGLVMGKIFEWFYNKKFWTSQNPERKCLESSDLAIDIVLDEKQFNRSSHPDFIRDLRRDIRKFVPLAVKSIRGHKLLTKSSRSEVDLTIDYLKDGMSIRMGGRADFIHGPKPVWIIDGKGSVHREKFLDSEQLIWYALLHYFKYHVTPTRLGFLHYRFPDDPIQWIMYDEQALRDTLNRTFSIATSILEGKFSPTPSGDCHRCEFCSVCLDGTRYLASRRVANGGRIGGSIFNLENVT